MKRRAAEGQPVVFPNQVPDYTFTVANNYGWNVDQEQIVKRGFLSKNLGKLAIATILGCTGSCAVFAQQSVSPQVPVEAPKPETVKTPLPVHHFWDKENDWLFVGVGAARALDYFSTLNFRRRGRQEILLTNDLVDNHAAFAAVEAGAVGLNIGVAYIFHHYDHHKLERWTSIVDIGLTTGGAIRNWSLKTAHPEDTPAQSFTFLRR
jgi:hypothetical protein